jgi:hypothetical protein
MRVSRTSNALRLTLFTLLKSVFLIKCSLISGLLPFPTMITFYLPPVCFSIERLAIEFLKCVLRIEINAITAESCSNEGFYLLGI